DTTVDDDWSAASDEVDDEDDDDGDGDEIEKASDPANQDRGDDHQNMGPVRFDREHLPTTYPLDMNRTVAKPARHKFDSRVDQVQERDNCSRNEAMSRARNEFPETYQDYQRHIARHSTQAQRVLHGGHFVGKSGPSTYDDLVAAEMRKGC